MVLIEYDEAFHIESEKKISYNEEFEDGLNALVHSLFKFIPDFDILYKKSSQTQPTKMSPLSR